VKVQPEVVHVQRDHVLRVRDYISGCVVPIHADMDRARRPHARDQIIQSRIELHVPVEVRELPIYAVREDLTLNVDVGWDRHCRAAIHMQAY
jgi:hypothetical protein